MIIRNEDNCKTVTCLECNKIMSQSAVMKTIVVLTCKNCVSELIYFKYDKMLIMGAKKEW